MNIFDIHIRLTAQHVQKLFEQSYANSNNISIKTNGYGGYELLFFRDPEPTAHTCFDINSPQYLQFLIKNNPLAFNADILRECPQHLKDIAECQEA